MICGFEMKIIACFGAPKVELAQQEPAEQAKWIAVPDKRRQPSRVGQTSGAASGRQNAFSQPTASSRPNQAARVSLCERPSGTRTDTLERPLVVYVSALWTLDSGSGLGANGANHREPARRRPWIFRAAKQKIRPPPYCRRSRLASPAGNLNPSPNLNLNRSLNPIRKHRASGALCVGR